MKNRILVLLFVTVLIGLFNTQKLTAQISSIASRETWIDVDSYNGFIANTAFKYQINLNGVHLNYSNWYLAVSLDSPIINGEGRSIDPSKMSIRINYIKGLGSTVAPTIHDLGIINTPKLLINNNAYIVENSNFILKTGGSHDNNKQYVFYFDIIVESGEYLEKLKSWNKYDMSLTFSVLASDKATVLTQNSVSTDFRIYPTDTPPSGPEFGFEVDASATLDFNTPEQYTRQVENDPNNSCINVTSKKSGYVIKVKANNPSFELIRNDSGVSGDATIPVDVVNVEMQSAGSGTSQGPKTLSSTTAQTLFIGTENNNPQKLPVRYFIEKTESEKLATKTSGEYKAILTYTLEPN